MTLPSFLPLLSIWVLLTPGIPVVGFASPGDAVPASPAVAPPLSASPASAPAASGQPSLDLGPNGLPGTALWVRVGPSARVQDPLAISDTECAGAPESMCRFLTDVLRRNLNLTGLFEMLDPKSYIADPAVDLLDQPRFDDWFNVKAKYLIKTRLSGSAGAMTMDFRLYSVLEKRALALPDPQVRGIADQKQLRKATYGFCNEVVRVVTGQPGFFGTRILYAAKAGPGRKGIGVLVVGDDEPGGMVSGDSINMLPSFSAGGVMYTSFRDGKPDIWVGHTKITKDNNEYRGARLSPDGSVIAVSVEVGGNADIYLMSPSGKLLQNLTNNWAADVSPTWSPDGSQLAFVSDRAGGPQIFVMSRGGGDARRVTLAGGYNSTPSWGASGKIAYAGMTPEGHSDIFAVGEGGGMERLTQDQGSNRDPAWSPDGRWVAFTSNRDGGSRIWVMTADGRYQFPLSEKTGSYSTLFWGR